MYIYLDKWLRTPPRCFVLNGERYESSAVNRPRRRVH